MKTWKVKHKHGYSEVEADSCEYGDGLLRFFKDNNAYFGTSIGGVEYWHEIGPRHYPPKPITVLDRIERIESILGEMQTVMDANNL